MEVEWDKTKAASNLRKHKVSFFEAVTALADHWAITFPDPDHSLVEDRFITIGSSVRNRILVVSHTERQDRIRIISARKATSEERETYEEEI